VIEPIGCGHDRGFSSTVQPDGKILLVGRSSNGTDDDLAIVRYDSDGTLDTGIDGVNTLNGAPAFIKGGPAVVLDADVNVRDTDLDALNGGSGNYDGASVVLVRNGGASTDDVFSFSDGNWITESGGNLIKNSQVIVDSLSIILTSRGS